MSGLGVPCVAETAETKRARRCVMQLERDLPCKDEALTDAAAALLVLSSASFDEGADCQTLARELERARMGGARLAEVCTLTGLDAHTVQRRRAGDGLTRGDRRPGAVRPASSHALTEAERTRIAAVASPTPHPRGLFRRSRMKASMSAVNQVSRWR